VSPGRNFGSGTWSDSSGRFGFFFGDSLSRIGRKRLIASRASGNYARQVYFTFREIIVAALALRQSDDQHE
jgi:hypothetical protein